MEKYLYTAYDTAGARHQDQVDAINRESATQKLKEMDLIPVSIERMDTNRKFKELPIFQQKPGFSDLEFFTSQLSLLLKGGIKIDRALATVKNGIKNDRLKKVIGEVYEDIRRGERLARALEKYPDIFDPLYVSIASIGEATGQLAGAFNDLAANLSFKKSIREKTRQALIYPSIIFAVCLSSVIFIFNFIVPKFSVVFAGLENLPAYTSLLLAVSSLFRKYQLVILGTIIGLVILAPRIKKGATFTRWRDGLALKFPITRQLSYTLENLRFTSSLAILLRSGVVLTEALGYSIQSVGNLLIRKQLFTLRDEIKQGKKLSESMAKTDFLPDIFEGIIEVGEETGGLAEVFSEMEKRLKDSYESKIQSFVNLIEPIMIIFMGLVVGSVVVIMLLSMVSISDVNLS